MQPQNNNDPQDPLYQDDLNADDNATDPVQDERPQTTDTTMPPEQLKEEFEKQETDDDTRERLEDSDENQADPPGDKIV